MTCARIASLALVAALALGPAEAVELGPLTAQVNPTTDSFADVQSTWIVDDVKGGFTALWARFEFDGAQALFARTYKTGAKPEGESIRFDARIDGARVEFNTLNGGLRVSNGPTIAVWGAQFPDDSGLETVIAEQDFTDGEADGKARVFPKKSVWTFRTVSLRDGRGLIAYTPRGRIDDARGAFVSEKGVVKRPFLKLADEGLQAIDVASLDKGFVSVFSRTTEDDKEETLAQIFDDAGRKVGGRFKFVPATPLFDLGSVAAVGLASGGIVALSFMVNEDFSGDIVAQRFDKSGRKIGKPKTLAKKVPPQPLDNATTYLPGGGFLLALVEGPRFGRQQLSFTRYGDDLSVVGKPAITKKLDGLRRGGVRLLTDGRVAAIYDLLGQKVFVQTVTP